MVRVNRPFGFAYTEQHIASLMSGFLRVVSLFIFIVISHRKRQLSNIYIESVCGVRINRKLKIYERKMTNIKERFCFRTM